MISTTLVKAMATAENRNRVAKFLRHVSGRTRHASISTVNFVRMNILNISELNTPEKRRRDQARMSLASQYYNKIVNNIHTCENKLHVDTAERMIEQYNSLYNDLCFDKYIELKEKLNMRKEELCMYC
jgi:hypothetical protein